MLEPVDLSLAAVPTRTRLARIAPRGLGTTRVESLTSLLMRLSATHHLQTGVLATRVLRPEMASPRNAKDAVRLCRLANGVGSLATGWAEAIASASAIEARNLTLLPWESVLPPTGLVDGFARHCPDCLHVSEADGVVYEPLLWTLSLVRVCVVHERPLQQRCASCGQRQEAISFRSRAGLCRRCGVWLGHSRRASAHPLSAWDRWVAVQLGELVANGGTRNTGGQLQSAVDAAVRALGNSQTDVANRIAVAKSSVSKWRTGRGRPALSGVLRLCALGNWSLRHFLAGRLVADAGPQTLEARSWAGEGARDWDGLQHRARKLAQVSPPPTLEQVATELRVGVHRLRKNLPELAAEIVGRRRRWKEERSRQRLAEATDLIESIVRGLQASGRYPSRRAVEAQLPKPLSLREPALQTAWKHAASN